MVKIRIIQTAFLLITTLIIICFSACNNAQTQTLNIVNDSIPEEIVDENPHINDSLEYVPRIIKEEDERFVDQNHILHINILNSQIKKGAQNRLLKALFPKAKIKSIENNPVYNGFEISMENEKYSAVFSFDQREDTSYLDVIFIAQGEYNIGYFESLFN